MTYLTNYEADENTSGDVQGATRRSVATPNGQTLSVCDRCESLSEHLEDVGECETLERWCLSCLKEEAERMVEEQQRDDEMRSLKGASDLDLERF